MGTLLAAHGNLLIAAFYQGLLAAGQPKKLALTLCMRERLTILNAMRGGRPPRPPAAAVVCHNARALC